MILEFEILSFGIWNPTNVQNLESRSGVSIGTDDRRNMSATLLREVGLFPKEEASSFRNVLSKKDIVIKSE